MPKKKILVADDEPDIIRLVKFTLEHKGYEVVAVNDGETALRKAQEIHPDLILLDVMMPVLDGYEACQRLKDSDLTKDIPILMLSAKSQEKEIEAGIEAGAKGFVSKPFSPKDLVTKVDEVFND